MLLIVPTAVRFVLCTTPSTATVTWVDVFAQVIFRQPVPARFAVPRTVTAGLPDVSLNRQNAGLARVLLPKISIFHSPPEVVDRPLRIRS